MRLTSLKGHVRLADGELLHVEWARKCQERQAAVSVPLARGRGEQLDQAGAQDQADELPSLVAYRETAVRIATQGGEQMARGF